METGYISKYYGDLRVLILLCGEYAHSKKTISSKEGAKRVIMKYYNGNASLLERKVKEEKRQLLLALEKYNETLYEIDRDPLSESYCLEHLVKFFSQDKNYSKTLKRLKRAEREGDIVYLEDLLGSFV